MPEIERCGWRDDALSWIHNDTERLPSPPPSNWHVEQPTLDARLSAVAVLRIVPSNLVPAGIGVTLDRGILMEWRSGLRELNVEALADGVLEVSEWMRGELIEETTFDKQTVWRLGRFFGAV